MVTLVKYKQHDTLSPLTTTLTGKTTPGDVVDLTAATSILVRAKQDGLVLFSRAPDSATNVGLVSMSWQAGDLGTPGLIALEVQVTWSAGNVQTFPHDTYLYAYVMPDLSGDVATRPTTPTTGTSDGFTVLARTPDAMVVGAVTRDSNDTPTLAAVLWPDGTPGTYTALVVSTTFPGTVDSYQITYGSSPVIHTYTQPTVTRDANGAATTVPAIVVT